MSVLEFVSCTARKSYRAFRRAIMMCRMEERKLFAYDRRLFLRYSGSVQTTEHEARLSAISMAFHVIEKGLTMPHKRLNFGHEALLDLLYMIDSYERDFGLDDNRVSHAIGVVKEYLDMHEKAGVDVEADTDFWSRLKDFCSSHPDIPRCLQMRMTKAELFSEVEKPFPEFAASRHTCRYYEGELPIETVEKAVKLAMTAPSACNRQHVRVHCVSNHETRDKIYTLQNGNRGFAKDADKLLVITADLNDLRWNEERNDIYINAGIFLMNLSYALHYHKVASCILNWSVPPKADIEMHKLLNIGENERIAALMACGPAPESVEIASSPRRSLEEIFTNHT